MSHQNPLVTRKFKFELNYYKLLSITVLAILLSGTVSLSYGAASTIPSPRAQIDDGVKPTDVVCKTGLKLIIRAGSNSAACVTSSSFDKMLQVGWAKTIEDFTNKPQISNIGDVNTIRIVPLYFNTGIHETKPEIITTYNYVFEACAKSSLIRSPEVLITSDSESRSVLLSSNIPAMSCQISTTIIKAANTSSIQGSLVKKADLSLIVGELESKVTNLQEKIASEKKELSEIIKQNPPSSDYNQKISEKTDKIISLRNDLNVARSDLQKNQYVLIVNSKSPVIVNPQLTNKEILPTEVPAKSYPHVNSIKTVPQYSDAGRLESDPLISSYNFVFEVCAGLNKIPFPEVMIRSDSEIKSIKLSEALRAYSCQTSSAKVNASDPNSIQGSIITTEDVSNLLNELEIKIALLQEKISLDKKSLDDLAKQSSQPDNFAKKISQLTEKIIKQRNELTQAKHEYISLKYMVNE